MSWAGDRKAGKEPGGQKEVVAGSPALGIGGITRPPRDLCIFSSLQCRYCPEICTWRKAEGVGGVQILLTSTLWIPHWGPSNPLCSLHSQVHLLVSQQHTL